MISANEVSTQSAALLIEAIIRQRLLDLIKTARAGAFIDPQDEDLVDASFWLSDLLHCSPATCGQAVLAGLREAIDAENRQQKTV